MNFVGNFKERLTLKRAFLLAALVEAVLITAGIYLSLASAGTPLSNASGSVLRSTVASYPGVILMVGGTSLLCITLSIYGSRHLKPFLRKCFIGSSILEIASLPTLFYYNFYVSYTTVIGSKLYDAYPYAVQSAIPFLLGSLLLFASGITLLAEKYGKKKTEKGYFLRLSMRDNRGNNRN